MQTFVVERKFKEKPLDTFFRSENSCLIVNLSLVEHVAISVANFRYANNT